MTVDYTQFCPVARTLDIVGDRWTILILRDLILEGPRKFQDFQHAFPRMSPNTLSTRLKTLEQHGIVERRIYEDHPPRAEYVVTDKGRAQAGAAVAAYLGRSTPEAALARGVKPKRSPLAQETFPLRIGLLPETRSLIPPPASVSEWRGGSTRVKASVGVGGARRGPPPWPPLRSAFPPHRFAGGGSTPRVMAAPHIAGTYLPFLTVRRIRRSSGPNDPFQSVVRPGLRQSRVR